MAEFLSLVRAQSAGPEPAPASRVATPESAFRRYAPYVAAVARRLLGHENEVEDVVQDVFVSALTGMDQIENPDALKSWLASITVRVVSRRLKRRKWRRFVGLERGGLEPAIEAPGASPEQLALLNGLYALLSEMPVAERVAWSLRYVEGERLEAVARHCGCSLATAKRRITSAQRQIDKELNQ